MKILRFAIFICLLTFSIAATAQEEDDQITDIPIQPDREVTDTLTESSFYDYYRFNAFAGDVILVTMTASDGLAPLIGIADAGRDIIARSDADPTGNRLPDAEPNTTAELELEIPATGEYAIVATRVGNADGTTTGSYTLIYRHSSNVPGSPDSTAQDVTFRCGEFIVTTAATIDFIGESDVDTYRISVYGLDDFQPVIRVVAGDQNIFNDCTDDAQQMNGDEARFPTGDTILLEAEDATDVKFENAAQLGLRGGDLLDRVRVTIAGKDGASGRYMVVIEGFTLSTARQSDYLDVRMGPLAASTEMLVYMVKEGQNRIDPVITLVNNEDSEQDVICDDAGLRDCNEVPVFTNYGVMFNDGAQVIGSRFDAGLHLLPGNADPMTLEFRSRAESAQGAYAVVLIGELP